MILLTGMTKDRGFLLLEVMISISILSIGLVLILSSFTGSLRAIDLSEDYFKAGLLMEEKLCEVCNSIIQEGSSEGRFSEDDNRYSWGLDIVKIEESLLYKIRLEVLWNEGSIEKNMVVETYLYSS